MPDTVIARRTPTPTPSPSPSCPAKAWRALQSARQAMGNASLDALLALAQLEIAIVGGGQ